MVCLQVLLRGRVATVRGKGKSCFIVLRQRTATVQVQHHGLHCFVATRCLSGVQIAVPTDDACIYLFTVLASQD